MKSTEAEQILKEEPPAINQVKQRGEPQGWNGY